MQWTTGDNAGFSEASAESLYLPVDSSDDRPDVATQLNQEASLLGHVQSLIQFRSCHSALRSTAEFQFLTDGTGYPLVYERWDEKERLLIAINPSPDSVSFYHESISKSHEILLGNAEIQGEEEAHLYLPPAGFAVIDITK